MLAALIYVSFHAYNNINKDLIDGRPVEAMVFSVLSNSIVPIFLLILSLNAEKRLRYSSFIEVIAKKGKFRFYSHDAEDFRMIADTGMQEKPS
ncbi:hypothetical protein HWN40_13040 [Methanolobus zinderi]|uniref:Uncharacterized protein n=1 Tax=Methanolobus zinderi TaxID=536044 RepID=A0A7D5EI53_9EURY|nr:hypothetical protein [Methanolobus zinderi]QLC51080.1 hypothetical protein HWN40_13040 [Methanolobus zinderi]